MTSAGPAIAVRFGLRMYNCSIMGQIVPDPIERYLAGLNHLADPVLRELEASAKEEDLPIIDAEVGALLHVLAMAAGAQRILEIGTAVGYSGIWLARALPPGGMLLTMEVSETRARAARENFERAGVADRASVIVGDARRMIAKVSGPFDLVFLDTDKELYNLLLDRIVDLLRPGGLLVADNVLWAGEVVPGYVAAPRKDPASTRFIAEFNERVNTHPKLATATVPIRDGISLSVKKRLAGR
jgi:predicted O-methyltransferase YrrM